MVVKFRSRLCLIVFLAFYFQSETPSYAFPINTDVAIQPAEGELIVRSQVRYVHASEESGDSDGKLDRLLLPQTLVYGFSPKFSTLVKAPLRYDDLDGRAPETDDFGVADIKVLGRYQVWREQAYLEANAFTLLGGLEFPSGDNPFSSRSFDPIAGFVVSRIKGRLGVFADLTYQFNTENSDDFERGDELKWDVAFEYRLYPKEWTRESNFSSSFIFELNGSYKQKSASNGNEVGSSGGTTVLLSPGAQLQFKRVILEMSVQWPIIQVLNGDQLETDVVVATGVRVFF